MIISDEKFIPIRNVGLILILIAAAFTLVYFAPDDITSDNIFSYIVFVIIVWHLFTGLGIIWQKKWGYYLFKFYLYVMLINPPVGTCLALKGLKYIKENEIYRFFDEGAIDL